MLQDVSRGHLGAAHRLQRPLALLALLAALATAPASAEESSASESIDALHAALIDVMKDAEALGYEGRARKLESVIPRHFDVDFMARKSLGSYWQKADESGRQRYLETFTRFMIANYAGRFDGFSGQSFRTRGEEPARLDTTIVKSVLIDPGGENVELNYRMRQVNGSWKIIDVYLDGTVSELALRRSEFVSILRRENFDALLVALNERIAKLAAGGEG